MFKVWRPYSHGVCGGLRYGGASVESQGTCSADACGVPCGTSGPTCMCEGTLKVKCMSNVSACTGHQGFPPNLGARGAAAVHAGQTACMWRMSYGGDGVCQSFTVIFRFFCEFFQYFIASGYSVLVTVFFEHFVCSYFFISAVMCRRVPQDYFKLKLMDF